MLYYDFFFVDTCGKKMKIKFKELVYVESAGNYVLLVGYNFKTIVYSSVGGILEKLESHQFLRIHKSYIISIEHIESIKGNECMLKWDNACVSIPIGVTYKKDVFEKLRIS